LQGTASADIIPFWDGSVRFFGGNGCGKFGQAKTPCLPPPTTDGMARDLTGTCHLKQVSTADQQEFCGSIGINKRLNRCTCSRVHQAPRLRDREQPQIYSSVPRILTLVRVLCYTR
jgi:hypothetical protein